MSDTKFNEFLERAAQIAGAVSWIKGAIVFIVVASFGAGVWATRLYMRVEDLLAETREAKVETAERTKELTTWRSIVDVKIERHENQLTNNTRRLDRLEKAD